MAERPKALALSEAASSGVSSDRLSANDESDLPRLISAAVTHVHDLIREFRPTRDQWRELIAFLTEVGHASDDRRQEWVLLSDLIGASTLVEELNSKRPQAATPNTIRGPFFRSDTPERASGASISLDGIGEPLMVGVRVQDLDGLPIAGAEVITWQANGEGFYENQQPDRQPEHNLRGLFRTDEEGHFQYRSVMPAGYGVPDDGPVGQLLARAGYSMRRPAHLHFVVRARGFETITTHIYDASDPHLAEDALSGVRPELVAIFEKIEFNGQDGKAVDLTFVMVEAKPGRAA